MVKKRDKFIERISGGFSAIPHAVLDGLAFQGASHPAKALLFELMRQHNGKNNGHFQLTNSWLGKRGWNSTDVVQRAKQELINRKLAIQTRQGGLNIGPSQFAVTWLHIDNFVGLDIKPHSYHPGNWRSLDPLPVSKKLLAHTVERNSVVPANGMAPATPVPQAGTKNANSAIAAIPPDGDNVYIPLPPKRKLLIRNRKEASTDKTMNETRTIIAGGRTYTRPIK